MNMMLYLCESFNRFVTINRAGAFGVYFIFEHGSLPINHSCKLYRLTITITACRPVYDMSAMKPAFNTAPSGSDTRSTSSASAHGSAASLQNRKKGAVSANTTPHAMMRRARADEPAPRSLCLAAIHERGQARE